MAEKTDHFIQRMRLQDAAATMRARGEHSEALNYALAQELLEIHDATGISLDNWATARLFVEVRLGETITENGV